MKRWYDVRPQARRLYSGQRCMDAALGFSPLVGRDVGRGFSIRGVFRKGMGVEMVKVSLLFVPADGAEVDHEMCVDLPAAPEVGDSLLIRRPPEAGYESFVVNRRWWMVDVAKSINPETAVHDTAARLVVECHYARCDRMSDEHGKTCDRYEARGMAIETLADTPY